MTVVMTRELDLAAVIKRMELDWQLLTFSIVQRMSHTYSIVPRRLFRGGLREAVSVKILILRTWFSKKYGKTDLFLLLFSFGFFGS